MTRPDEDLIRAVAAGDEGALLVVAERWTPVLRDLFTCWRGGRGGDVTSAVTATWVRVIRDAAAFRVPPGPRAWLCRTALEEARTRGWITGSAADYRRAHPGPSVDRASFLPASHEQWPGHWADPPRPWTGRSRPLPSWAASRESLLADVGALPEPCRLAVTLRDVAGCRAGEVAAVLAVPLPHVRTLLQGGRAGVRAALDTRLAGAASLA